MNAQTHLLIFNKSRGCLMAQGVHASSSGAGGDSGARRIRRCGYLITNHGLQVEDADKTALCVVSEEHQNNTDCKNLSSLFGVSTNTTQTSHTETTTTAGVWQAQSGNGSTSQSANQTQINGQLSVASGINTTVMIPEGELKTQVLQLSQQPGLAYLGELAKDPKINWQHIKLAQDNWSYSQQGLTPAGAALLSIAIAAYTGGMGSELLGGTAATSTSAATLMGSTVYGAAANAGFAALASSAGVSFVNNGGDIGKTLKDMGSSQNVKNTLTAMATAGVLNALGSPPTATGQTGANAQAISTMQAVDKFAANLAQNVTNNLASAVVSSAINGKPLNEETLGTALSSAFITAGMAQAANSIGAATQNGTLNAYTQALAHALAGCVGGAATTGNSGGCSAGAVGAVVGELTMKFATDNQITGSNALKLAGSMSAVAGAVVGGPNSAAAVNVASQMGTNAALNNFCAGQAGCVNRRFTFSDAVAHWRSGNGTPITDVDASELNLKGATFTKVSDGVYLVHTSLAYDTGAIYGAVTGFINPDGTMSFKPDTYNFDLKGYSDVNSMASALARTQRNVLTGAGLLVNGVGDSYNIYFKGSIPAPANLPK